MQGLYDVICELHGDFIGLPTKIINTYIPIYTYV